MVDVLLAMSPSPNEPPSFGDLAPLGPSPEPAQEPVLDAKSGLGQETGRPPKDPGVSRTRAGFSLLIAATIGGAVVALIPILSPFAIEARFTLIVPLLAIVGAAVVYWGRHSWPPQGHAAAAGFGLVLAASGSTLFLGVFGVPDFVPSGLSSTYPLALVIQIVSVLAVLMIGTIGFLLLVWGITSAAPRRLILAGTLTSFGYFAASNLLVVAFTDPSAGGASSAAQSAAAILLWMFVPVVAVTTALTTFGLVVARWRLGTTGQVAQVAPI